jgi:hypothetical protein
MFTIVVSLIIQMFTETFCLLDQCLGGMTFIKLQIDSIVHISLI